MEEKFCRNCQEPETEKIIPCPLQCMSPKCKAYTSERKINVHHKPIIWLLGGPGSGKGTQCEKIAKKYGYTHVAPGDLLRAEAVSGSIRAKCISNILTRGGLVPNDIILDIIKDTILKDVGTSKGYVIDGYPREKMQGEAFERTIASPTAIIYLEASPETLYKRVMGRAAKVGRIDDSEQSVKQRIQTFLTNNNEILEQYHSKVLQIDAEVAAEAVFAVIQKIMNPIVQNAQAALAASVPQLPMSIELP